MGALRRRRARAHHTKMSLTRSLVAQSMLGLARAQSGGASSSSNEERAASDDSEGGDDSESSGSKGASLYVDYLQDGYAVLVRRRKKFWDPTKTKTICGQNPFILSHDGPSTNGNCLDGINKANRSCTCITGVTKNNPEWTFTVTKKKRKSNAVMPLTASNPIAITGIAPMFTGSVSTLNIIGVGPDPEKIPFLKGVDNDGTPVDPTLEFAKSSEKALTKVVIQNVDLNDALSNPDFFSPWLTNLTLRNCNIQDGKTGFLKKLGSLQYLNMANNNLTVLPQEIMYAFELKYVYLNGNPITNLTVSEKLYLSVNGLDAFEVGSVTATNCTSQSSRQSHGVKFCVPVSTGAAGGNTTVAPSASDSSGSNKFLLIGVIGGCVIVVVLLFFVVRKRSSSQNKENAFVKHTNSVFEDTLSFDHSSQHASVSSTLLNDPIIITHRIPYNDIKIATCISRGGFGLVYSGTFNRRRVAVKKIRSDINADIKQIEMFLKEICLMASLNHPRIVEFIGVSWDSLRNLCAVTEFMERGDLRDVLQSARARNARLSWDSHKSQIAMHVAEALTYLHSLSPKVIHRDLKSKNILLDNEMTAKLSDFGVSRERRIEETHMTAGIGTAFWIAPEVLLGMDYDERADIFSFGIVLSEIDTEDYPYWNEKNPASGGKQQENVILRMVATGALRPEFSDACPQAILDLAAACLDVNPDRRPTAAQVVYTLHQLIRSSPLTPASGITPL